MLPGELHKEIISLQLEIETNEKSFDAALQHTPSQLELARIIYKNIKVLEGRLADLKALLDLPSGS
ncbi:MAG TPA: hypothetical protein VGH64_16885 [Puia sp.]|jgi:hypothetical protein